MPFDRRIDSLPRMADAMAAFARPQTQPVRSVRPGNHQLRIGEHLVIRTQRFEDSGIVQLPEYKRDKIGIESRITVLGLGWIQITPPPGIDINNSDEGIYASHLSPATVMLLDSGAYWASQPSYTIPHSTVTTGGTALDITLATVSSNLIVTRYPGEAITFLASAYFTTTTAADLEATLQVYNSTTSTGIRSVASRTNNDYDSCTPVIHETVSTTLHVPGTQNTYVLRASESGANMTINYRSLTVTRHGPNV